jgi:GNAT superfamily N-acetyltransferase
LRDAIPSGEYTGWLALDPDDSARVVAGAGAQMREVIPFPLTNSAGSVRVADGRQAIVVNVYTEPAHRRRGLARLLMNEVIQWARDTRVESLVLHAAPDGRPLYDQLGFQSTNEMRYMPDL